jgi:hypothetical protein
MARKKGFWIGEGALFLGGTLPTISRNKEIPPEILHNGKYVKRFAKLREDGLIVDSLDDKTNANIAVKTKNKELKKVLKENEKLTAENAKLKQENADLRRNLVDRTVERDKAIKLSLGGK